MFKKLPKYPKFKLLIAILVIPVFLFSFFQSLSSVLAITPNSTANVTTSAGTNIDQAAVDAIGPTSGWQPDDEVTFTGKMAVRAQDTLDFLLKNYNWAQNDQKPDPFAVVFKSIQTVIFYILVLFFLAGAFLMITTRGKSLTVKRLLLRYLIVVVLVYLIFDAIKFIYYLSDIVQYFFLWKGGARDNLITTEDLLHVGFNYVPFQGFRKMDPSATESAVISLLLIKLTAATYYTMFFILIIRKIILWFFIIVSPIFPLLLFFKPIRNTAKIWTGEFFRWLLYAPLFAIFLRGVVEFWRIKIPLAFDFSNAGTIIYPTAINILLAGPGQPALGNNSINLPDTFILYVVALIMLWVVIIMPWILLKIFLDYYNSFNVGDSSFAKYLTNPNSPLSPLFARYRSPQGSPPPGTPPGPASTGLAKSLPIARYKHSAITEVQTAMQQTAQREAEMMNNISQAAGRNISQVATQTMGQIAQNQAQTNISNLRSVGSSQDVSNLNINSVSAQLLQATNLTIPTMQDIAKYEAAMMSSQAPAKAEVQKITEALNQIAGRSPIASSTEKQKYSQIKEKLTQESVKGNAIAQSVSKAVNAQAAKTAGTTGGAGPGLGGKAPSPNLPAVNNTQQVNLDDYEDVKKTWEDNYRNLDVPLDDNGQPQTRSQWLKHEVANIPEVIDLLLSGNPRLEEEGKQRVSKILPFLLLGGFSKQEIIAYLKAKLEAAKTVLREVTAEEATAQEEDSKVEVTGQKPEQNTMTMHAQAELPKEEPKNPNK